VHNTRDADPCTDFPHCVIIIIIIINAKTIVTLSRNHVSEELNMTGLIVI